MALVKLTASAIGRIGDGQRVDLRNTNDNDFEAINARVAYVHPYDETLVIEIVTRSGGGSGEPDDTYQTNGSTPLANWDALNTSLATQTVIIVQHDSWGNSPSGTLAGLFDVTSSYFGTARDTVTGNQGMQRMLQPIRVDASAGGANVPLTADWYRRVGEIVGWQQGAHNEGGPKLAQIMSKYEYRQIASFIKEEGITLTPALESDVGKGLNKAFGFDGFILHDPSLGTQMIIVDDFATPGQIDFINRAQWEQVSPIDGGFRMFPGNIAGIWSRDNQTGTGVTHLPGKTYSANGLLLACWVCRWPKGQIRLQGLSTT